MSFKDWGEYGWQINRIVTSSPSIKTMSQHLTPVQSENHASKLARSRELARSLQSHQQSEQQMP